MLALALSSDGRFPFFPDSYFLSEAEPAPETDPTDVPDTPAPDWEGLPDRIYEVPIPPGNYSRLRAGSSHLYVLENALNSQPAVKSVALDHHAKTEVVAENVVTFDLSTNGKTILIGQEKALLLVDAKAKLPTEGIERFTIPLEGWPLRIDPAREWRQMFYDAWRMHRDFAFDRNLRNVDWEALRDKYTPLLERVNHRQELDDLLGDMIAELGILHSQVGRSELPRDPEKPQIAVLGGEYRETGRGLEITRILRGDPDVLEDRVPLGRPEADVIIGDVLTRVAGMPVRTLGDLYEALKHQVDQPIVLEVERGESSHRTIVRPASAQQLPWWRYRDWEQDRLAEVETLSNGRVGYLHLASMVGRDVADFAREFYSFIDRDGIVIDVRRNNGGNVDSWILANLLRRAWAFWEEAHGNHVVGTNMQQAFRGHLAVLIDERTYSDGETFAAGIKALDLAPLIGVQTSGAGIWLSGRNTLADNGVARIAETPQFALDGRWLIEGRGVSPDIEVMNLPVATYRGEDRQLEAAVHYLLERAEVDPILELRGVDIPPVGTAADDID